MAGTIGPTQSVMHGTDGKDGFGFTVMDDDGRIRVTFAYESKAESKKAEETIRAAIANAIWAKGPP